MTSTIVVLLSGKQGSGKTTLASSLFDWFEHSGHGKEVNAIMHLPLKFADTIYRIHDLAWKELEPYGFEKPQPKDGRLLQLLGTEWGRRTIDENIWVELVRRKIEARAKEFKDIPWARFQIFVVEDCRFRKEIDAFPGALSYWLDCPEEERKLRCEQWRPDTQHASEIDLDSYAANGQFTATLYTNDYPKEKTFERVRNDILMTINYGEALNADAQH
jgi:hypothetical protein